jgi:hypothetical protein
MSPASWCSHAGGTQEISHEGVAGAVAIRLEITTTAVAELCRRGMVTLATSGTRKQLPLGSSEQRLDTSA